MLTTELDSGEEIRTVSVSSPVQSDFDMRVAVTGNRWLGIWRLSNGFRVLYAGAGLSLAVSTLARTTSLLLIGYFVDDVLPGDNVAQVVPLIALGFVLLAMVQGAFAFLSGRWAAQTSEGLALRLRDFLYDHVQRLTYTYHDNMQTGELLQRCTSDIDAVRRFFAEQSIGVVRILVMFFVNFAVILTIDVRLAFLSVMIIPLVVLVSLFFFKRISDKYEAFQNQEAKLSTRIQETLTGVRVVRAFARQQYEIDKFEVDNHGQFEKGRELSMMHAYFWPVTDLITGFQLLFGYFVGALMVISGDITLGSYVAYIGMVVLIIYPMRDLGRLIAQTSTGLVSFDRVMGIVKEGREELGEEATSPVNTLHGDIVFDGVNFQYDDEHPVLEDVSFTIKAGQTVALLGATGSGKTSLVNLLPRFYEYNSGSITLDGVELNEYPRQFLRQNIGVVEQEPFLFSRTLRENIAFGVGREVSDEEIERAAHAAAIHEVIESFPEGYDTLVGERGVTLSGGQKQRTVLARTLLKNPRILILDDATSSVDTETESHIRNALRGMMDQRTTFIIAHRITTVMHADLILVFDHGKIVQMGKHDELVKQPGIYRRTYDMQSRIESELEREIESA